METTKAIYSTVFLAGRAANEGGRSDGGNQILFRAEKSKKERNSGEGEKKKTERAAPARSRRGKVAISEGRQVEGDGCQFPGLDYVHFVRDFKSGP